MRVKVDRKICQGHGLYYLTSDRLFRLSHIDGKAEVLVNPVPPELKEVARSAADACPEQAITVIHD